MKAIWNDQIIAESDETIVVENNHYFPPASIRRELLVHSTRQSTCPWKGEASYFHVQIEENELKDAAWYYPQPKNEAAHIADYVAFWKGVRVVQ